jgi:hypothetical protein
MMIGALAEGQTRGIIAENNNKMMTHRQQILYEIGR